MTPRAHRLFIEWHGGQGAKVKAARPMAVYGQCVMLAKDLANRADEHVGNVLLTTEQIGLCEQRALSSARLGMFGPPPADPEAWAKQLEQVREAWSTTPTPQRRAA